MSYFENVTSYDNLKVQYRTLARANHPDVGGTEEAMKAINAEYDRLFPIWKHRSEVVNDETATSTRSEFYTQNGWKGENYNPSITTKEIACIIREYLKDVHNDYRFSVRSEYNYLTVTMTESPSEVFTGNEKHIQINHYYVDREDRLTESAKAVIQDIVSVINSYRMDDSDGMIDYFDTNFYMSINVGDYDRPVKIVPRTKKVASNVEYETVTVTKTRTKKELKPQEIKTPTEFAPGQRFILKASFNYGCYRGAVYEIDHMSGNVVYSYKMGRGYKNVCKGNVRGNSFSATAERLKMWVEKGAIAFIDLVEVEKTEEYTSSVRRPKKQTRLSTNVSTEEATPNTQASTNQYEIIPDVDTRDNSKIFVVKVKNKVEDFSSLRSEMKKIDGYYSKFKHGFIFKYDPTDVLNGSENATSEKPEQSKPEDQPKQQDRTKTIERINKAIDGVQNKINKISGDYKTNTYKRMREQEGREAKIEGYRLDLNILSYLLETAQERELTLLEMALITESFRDEIHGYYMRFETWNLKEDKRPSSSRPVKYPEKDLSYPDSWWNQEVPKMQKRLQKANISNTDELVASIEEYKKIVESTNKPQNKTALKIKRLEREYKMTQKGDINFTPENIAKQLVDYSRIDANSRVLEPSAGIGNIADVIKDATEHIDVVERMCNFRELLQLKGYNLVGDDFLEYETENLYDAIIMNPPFSDEQAHIKHAYDLLKPNGTLVAVCSQHWTFANDKKSQEFREWAENENSFTVDLPAGTFEMTRVPTKILVIEKPAQEEQKTA